MWCMPKSSSSQPAVVDNYRRRRYEEEHTSPSNQLRIDQRRELYQTEHDAQLTIALSAQERSDQYDLDTALALSKSMMDIEAIPNDQDDLNEEQALLLAQALSLSEIETSNKETKDEEPTRTDNGEIVQSDMKKIPAIDDDQYKDIGEVSKDALSADRNTV